MALKLIYCNSNIHSFEEVQFVGHLDPFVLEVTVSMFLQGGVDHGKFESRPVVARL